MEGILSFKFSLSHHFAGFPLGNTELAVNHHPPSKKDSHPPEYESYNEAKENR
jgi:hypothetical protein